MEGISVVRIGCCDYQIVPMTQDEIDEVGHGVCNFSSCVIKIDTTQCYQRQVETLWHEVKHAIHKLADLTDDSKEEDYCMRAAPLELHVLRENPRLMEILLRCDNATMASDSGQPERMSPEGNRGRWRRNN